MTDKNMLCLHVQVILGTDQHIGQENPGIIQVDFEVPTITNILTIGQIVLHPYTFLFGTFILIQGVPLTYLVKVT